MQALRQFVRRFPFLRNLFGYHIASSRWFDSYFEGYKLTEAWKARVDDVLASEDFGKIVKVPGAGEIRNGSQLMHNGLRVHNGSYYGPEYAQLLKLCEGVHEPQEEYVFQEVLKQMRRGSVMIEMGAFWSFYSMWFKQQVPEAKNYMIEPESFNLGHGKRNFALNGFKGDFTHALVGKDSAPGRPPVVSVDDFVSSKKIDFVDLLHSDIQGYEFEMLGGAERLFRDNRVGYVFISTHNDTVHEECLGFLRDRSFVIIADADMQSTYSVDGLIVARSSTYPGIDPIQISKKQR